MSKQISLVFRKLAIEIAALSRKEMKLSSQKISNHASLHSFSGLPCHDC
jgi:hypothetical protein